MALSSARNTPLKETELIPVPVAAGAKIYAGAITATNSAGFGVPGALAATLTYIGRSEQTIDNTGGADGAQIALVRRKKAFKWANSGADPVTQADFGKLCYIVDDQTVARTNGTNTRSAAGKVLGIDPDGVWVD